MNKNRIWRELQIDLAGQSTRGRLITAENSGHDLRYTQPQPERVLQSILAVLAD